MVVCSDKGKAWRRRAFWQRDYTPAELCEGLVPPAGCAPRRGGPHGGWRCPRGAPAEPPPALFPPAALPHSQKAPWREDGRRAEPPPPWLFFFFMNGGGDVSAPRPFPRAPAIHAAGAARRGGAGRGGSKGTEAPGGRGDRNGDRETATTMVATEGLREMEGSALRRLVGRDEASPGPGGGGPGGSSGGPGGSSGGPGRCLVLDCRPFLAHSAGHIRGALNVRCNTIVRRRAKGAVSLEQILPAEGEVRARLRAGLYAAVVVYDERSPRAEALRDDSTVALVVRALRRDSARADIRLLAGTGGRGEKRGVPPLSPPQLLSLLTPACPRGEPPLPEVPGPRGWRPEGAAGGWEAPGGGSRAERAPRRCPGLMLSVLGARGKIRGPKVQQVEEGGSPPLCASSSPAWWYREGIAPTRTKSHPKS